MRRSLGLLLGVGALLVSVSSQAGAQQPPGVLFGVATPTQTWGYERFEIRAHGNGLMILSAPYGKAPRPWGPLIAKQDGSLEFNWGNDPEVPCTFRRVDERNYSGPSVWNRRDDRVCEDDAERKSWSVFCALYQASLTVTGEYLHARPVMTEARAALARLTRGRSFQHPIMDFNNFESTTYADVVMLRDLTEQQLQSKRVK